jgi:hypothetical protein
MAAQMLERAASKTGGKVKKKKGKGKAKKGKAGAKGRAGKGKDDEVKIPSKVLAIRTYAQSMRTLETSGALTVSTETTPLERCELTNLSAIDDLAREPKLAEKPQYVEMHQYVQSIMSSRSPPAEYAVSTEAVSTSASTRTQPNGGEESPLATQAEVAFCRALIGHLRRLAHLPLDVAIGSGDKRKPTGKAKPGGRRPAAKTPAKPRVQPPPLSDTALAAQALSKRLPALYQWFTKEQQRVELGRAKQLTQMKAAQGAVVEGAEVFVWCGYDPVTSRMATGWYRGQIKRDCGDGSYEVQMLRGDRRNALRRWIRAEPKLRDREKQLVAGAAQRSKQRRIGQAKLEAAKAALLQCQLPKYAHMQTLIGREVATGEVGSVRVVMDDEEGGAWTLDMSVWKPRLKESDSRDFYEDAGCWAGCEEKWRDVKGMAFDNDWAMSRLGKIGQRIVPEERLPACKAVLLKHWSTIHEVMTTYGAFTPSFAFAVSWNGYRELIRNCEIFSEGTGDMEAADTVFMVANREQEEEEDALNDNSNKCLERFEMLECLVRMAQLKMRSKKKRGGERGGRASPTNEMPATIDEQLGLLFTEHLVPLAVEQAPKDAWRKDRMYRRDVSDVLLRYSIT